jgi:hypothetical protein
MMAENDGKTGNGASASACPDNVVNMMSNIIPFAGSGLVGNFIYLE